MESYGCCYYVSVYTDTIPLPKIIEHLLYLGTLHLKYKKCIFPSLWLQESYNLLRKTESQTHKCSLTSDIGKCFLKCLRKECFNHQCLPLIKCRSFLPYLVLCIFQVMNLQIIFTLKPQNGCKCSGKL